MTIPVKYDMIREKIKKIDDYSLYKYVRMGNDELRFIKAYAYNFHTDLVNLKTETPISAGIIGIFPDYFTMYKEGSLSLKIRKSLPSDIELLSKELNREYKIDDKMRF